MGKLVAYFRVSTRKQGESGLGLEAQQSCVADFARYGQHEIIAVYQEIETGKRSDRPEGQPRRFLTRNVPRRPWSLPSWTALPRNVHFLSKSSWNRSVDFVCCDNPNANRLTLHILAAVAEDEARRISVRYEGRAGGLQSQRGEARHAREPDTRCRPEGERDHAGEGEDRVCGAASRVASLEGIRTELQANRGSSQWRRPHYEDGGSLEPQPGQKGVVP